MSEKKLSEIERTAVLIMQGVGPMDQKTLAKIIQNETEFSDQQVKFALEQHMKGPSHTTKTIKDAFELLGEHRPEVIKTIHKEQPKQLKRK